MLKKIQMMGPDPTPERVSWGSPSSRSSMASICSLQRFRVPCFVNNHHGLSSNRGAKHEKIWPEKSKKNLYSEACTTGKLSCAGQELSCEDVTVKYLQQSCYRPQSSDAWIYWLAFCSKWKQVNSHIYIGYSDPPPVDAPTHRLH
jgi:hypothetical protein